MYVNKYKILFVSYRNGCTLNEGGHAILKCKKFDWLVVLQKRFDDGLQLFSLLRKWTVYIHQSCAKITSSGMLIYVKTNKTKTQGPGGQASFCISNFHGQKLIIWVPQKNVSSLPRVFKYIATRFWKAIKYNDTKSFGVLNIH